METKNGIEQAIAKIGGQVALAQAVGCSQQNVSAWLKRGHAPLSRAVEIEQATGVPRRALIDPRIHGLLDTTSV
jgi:DNA-binding transcriptional regulator YdaS (Cro superfamily)